MLFKGKVKKILDEQAGEKAIMAIDMLLTPIYYSKTYKLSEEEKTIVYIEALEREINNGGFSQFFFNSSGDDTEETVRALRNVGSNKFLGLLISAIEQFPNSYVPKDRVERQHILERVEATARQTWNDLDTEFYKYEEDLYSLLRNYMLANIKRFR